MALLRFAPSPTGFLHLGGLRTALFNHLFSRKLGGKWLLRIEDTDQARSVPGSVEDIQASLEWAKLDYDFGPGRESLHSPYYQSQRLDLYHSYAHRLLQSGRAYRCFCSPSALSETREILKASGSHATYDRACLKLTDEDVTRRVRAGHSHIIRLNQSSTSDVLPGSDLIFGPLRPTLASLATDPVLLKTDKFPTYHLASVVDDHEMGITHVLRGEEWLPSLSLHLELYNALGLPAPQFAHIPILLNPDGTKMSKRKGDVHVKEYIKKGWEPNAVLSWLAHTGSGGQRDPHAAATSGSGGSGDLDLRPHTLEELVQRFDLGALTHRRTILDPGKLAYLNKHCISRELSTPQGHNNITSRATKCIRDLYPQIRVDDHYVARVLTTLSDRLTNVQKIGQLTPYLFVEPTLSSPTAVLLRSAIPSHAYDLALDAAIRSFSNIAITDFTHQPLQNAIAGVLKTSGIESKYLMNTLRFALTGTKIGPTVLDILCLLGKDQTLGRLEKARNFQSGGE